MEFPTNSIKLGDKTQRSQQDFKNAKIEAKQN